MMKTSGNLQVRVFRVCQKGQGKSTAICGLFLIPLRSAERDFEGKLVQGFFFGSVEEGSSYQNQHIVAVTAHRTVEKHV